MNTKDFFLEDLESDCKENLLLPPNYFEDETFGEDLERMIERVVQRIRHDRRMKEILVYSRGSLPYMILWGISHQYWSLYAKHRSLPTKRDVIGDIFHFLRSYQKLHEVVNEKDDENKPEKCPVVPLNPTKQ